MVTVVRTHLHMYAPAAFTSCGYYSRVAFILFKSFRSCGYYSRVAFILFKSFGSCGYYSRVASI